MTSYSHWKSLSYSDDAFHRIDYEGDHFEYHMSAVHAMQRDRVNARIVHLSSLDNYEKTFDIANGS